MFIKNEYDKPRYNPYPTPPEEAFMWAKANVDKFWKVFEKLDLETDFSKMPFDDFTVYTTRKMKDEIERIFSNKDALWSGGEFMIPMKFDPKFIDDRPMTDYIKGIFVLLLDKFRDYNPKLRDVRIDYTNRWVKLAISNK